MHMLLEMPTTFTVYTASSTSHDCLGKVGRINCTRMDLGLWFNGLVLWTSLFGKILGTYNVDPSFSIWPVKSAIPYYMDTSYYTTTEQNLIRSGISKIIADLQGCVNFVETTASDPRFKIFITPYNDAGVLQTFCHSYQGQVNFLVNGGAKFQRIIITRGFPYGCLDGTLHNIMKYFAIVLGKRNEHQRNDRELYIGVNNANIAIQNSYRLYNVSEARWDLFPYDFCSITHNRINDYSTSGTNVFTVLSSPPVVPFLDRISQTDCLLITMFYNCSTTCPPLDCNAARQAAAGIVTTAAPVSVTPTVTPPATTTPAVTIPAVTTPATTTPAVTTTTPLPTTTSGACPSNYFCTHTTDESSYLLGPYQLYQTLVMYSGPCIMEYNFNWGTVLFDPVGPAMPATSYFPPPGGPTEVTPVDVAYMQLDPATNGASLQLVTASSASGTGLTCSTDPSVATKAAKCPTPSGTSATITKALSLVSSVTTQINLAIGDIYQYAVLKPGSKEIALMSADFATTYATSTGFLSGQSTIVTITALQILQDQNAVNPDMLAVFGTGADGKPYVGFVDLLLTADPTLPIAPFTWLLNPIPIAAQLSRYCP